MEEKSEKEKRIRAITKLYYSNPKIQKALMQFSANREVVPRYFEGFGKRPDSVQYPSDIIGWVNKGATSFHASEEIWHDQLKLSSDISQEEMNNLRKSWDLLLDIDSPYFDVSKEAVKLVLELLEGYGIKNYGIKFSGSKGFHIIISGKAFPEEYDRMLMKSMFPEWPRAVTEFISKEIKPEFRKRVGKIMSFSHLDKKEDSVRVYCKQCNNIALKGALLKFTCPVCNFNIERRDIKASKRRLKCLNEKCPGVLEITDSLDYYYCKNCKDSENENLPLSSNKYPELFEQIRGELADEHAELDLILVAPRHLFRMPYSLHEKTSLASIVLKKGQIASFSPKDADPLKAQVIEFLPNNNSEEAKKLLITALEWKKSTQSEEEKTKIKKYESYNNIDLSGITESMFPSPIKKLLLGLHEGRKRGLFIVITFLKALNFPPEYINLRIREWNKLNTPPLKEGYLKSQIDWHLRQKKKLMPPNYDNASFYADLNLLDKKPESKNPVVDTLKRLRRKNG